MECEVVILGLGPVGAVAANLLGQYGVTVRVVERNASIYSAPRTRPSASLCIPQATIKVEEGYCPTHIVNKAIAIDAEASRIFSMIDLGEWLDGHVHASGAQLRTQSVPHGTVLVDASDIVKRRKYGFHQIATVHQPTVEEKLRERLQFFPNVQVYLEYEAVDLLEENGRVTVTVRRVGSTHHETFSCQYVLACDGGESFARRKLGLRYKGNQLQERWLVMNVASSDQDFEQAWSNATVVCGQKRTFFTAALPQNLRRFELLLHPNEEAARVVLETEAARLLADIGVDAHKFVFHRRMVYKFHARQVESWRKSRVLLAGDAAHCMPPIKGQGMCCGVEDAGNLCWKIAMVLRGTMKNSLPTATSAGSGPHEQLLDSYQVEREFWVAKMTSQNLKIRRLASLRNSALVCIRNVVLYTVDHIPGVRDWLRFEKYKGSPDMEGGFVDKDSAGSGRLFPQPKVQTVTAGALSSVLLDKVLGYGWCLLVYDRVVGDVLSVSCRSQLEKIGCRTVHILPCGSDLTSAAKGLSEDVVVDEEDVLKSWFRQHLADAALLRPDRFVFGTIQRNGSGDHLVEHLQAMLSGARPLSPSATDQHNWPIVSAIAFIIGLFVLLWMFLL